MVQKRTRREQAGDNQRSLDFSCRHRSFLTVVFYHGRELHVKGVSLYLRADPCASAFFSLVFASFGRILYELKFYYILYMIMVVFLRVKKAAYEEFKKLLWHLMMAFVGFVVVPWIIDVLNKVISFFDHQFSV